MTGASKKQTPTYYEGSIYYKDFRKGHHKFLETSISRSLQESEALM